MAQERSGNNPSGRGGRPARGNDQRRGGGSGDQRRGAGSDQRGGRGGSDQRGGRGGSDQRRGGEDRRGGGKPGGGRPYSRPGRPARDDRAPRTTEQAVYDGPDLPEDVTGKELDKQVAAQLKGLPEKLASRVAARARAPRLAVVREAAGEAAYAAGHYSEALAELRAAKRMNGATDYLPIMADCHRALGQPQQAIKLAQSPSVANFAAPAKAEMTIVEAGARRDMGQLDAALRVLEQAPLMNKSREPWVVRLRYAYADTLEAAGRPTEALTWFHRTDAIDAEELTDAAARAASLESASE